MRYPLLRKVRNSPNDSRFDYSLFLIPVSTSLGSVSCATWQMACRRTIKMFERLVRQAVIERKYQPCCMTVRHKCIQDLRSSLFISVNHPSSDPVGVRTSEGQSGCHYLVIPYNSGLYRILAPLSLFTPLLRRIVCYKIRNISQRAQEF